MLLLFCSALKRVFRRTFSDPAKNRLIPAIVTRVTGQSFLFAGSLILQAYQSVHLPEYLDVLVLLQPLLGLDLHANTR